MAQERILIVDGDILVLQTLTARLEARGYLVSSVRTGYRAMRVLRNTWIDLIILPVSLPGGMTGFHLFKEIKNKKKFSKIPVIVHCSRPGMKEVFKTMGAEAFVVKPEFTDTVSEVVRDILRKRRSI